ncbi:MAG: hypothetical protein M0C28_07890 [Candidatus Moduliflexus flocculans]|nr:hypothetical protein [Candidatus Moduliflexus flocculans]
MPEVWRARDRRAGRRGLPAVAGRARRGVLALEGLSTARALAPCPGRVHRGGGSSVVTPPRSPRPGPAEPASARARLLDAWFRGGLPRARLKLGIWARRQRWFDSATYGSVSEGATWASCTATSGPVPCGGSCGCSRRVASRWAWRLLAAGLAVIPLAPAV